MIIQLTGVFDDGTPFGPSVPQNAAKTIRMPLGANVEVVLTVLDNAGTPVRLDGDVMSTAVLTVKVASGYQQTVLSKTGTAPTPLVPGQRLFTIVPNDTKLVKLPNGPGRYVYDIWVTYDGIRNQVIPVSPWIIEAATGLL